MQMKKNILLAISCLLCLNANALIISVEGYDEVPEEGLEITITEAPINPLSGLPQVELKGNIVCVAPLTVNITRSSAGLSDEFCLGQCIPGNGQTTETLQFTPSGMESWYAHYSPVPNSHETIVYTFTDANESLTITVHYFLGTEGMKEINGEQKSSSGKKVLREGILYIEKNNKTYTIL